MTQEQKWLSYVAELREKHDKELCGWIDECKSARADISKLVEDRNNLIDEINSIRAEKAQLEIEMETAVRLLQTCVHDNLPINEAINFVQAYWNKHNIFPYEP